MGRANFVVTLAFAIVFYSQSLTQAQRPDEAIRHARSLLADACKLRGLLDSAGADPFTLRSACRLEGTAEELVEKLSCAGHADQAGVLVDDCILWYNRTSVGVRRECRLANDRTIASALSCTGRQLRLLEDAVDCMFRHRAGAANRSNPFRQPTWIAPPTGYAPVQNPELQPLPTQPGNWVNGPFGVPTSPRGAFIDQGEYRGFGQPNVREFGNRGMPSQSPSPRGQIARAVLELMLSEMSR